MNTNQSSASNDVCLMTHNGVEMIKVILYAPMGLKALTEAILWALRGNNAEEVALPEEIISLVQTALTLTTWKTTSNSSVDGELNLAYTNTSYVLIPRAAFDLLTKCCPPIRCDADGKYLPADKQPIRRRKFEENHAFTVMGLFDPSLNRHFAFKERVSYTDGEGKVRTIHYQHNKLQINFPQVTPSMALTSEAKVIEMSRPLIEARVKAMMASIRTLTGFSQDQFRMSVQNGSFPHIAITFGGDVPESTRDFIRSIFDRQVVEVSFDYEPTDEELEAEAEARAEAGEEEAEEEEVPTREFRRLVGFWAQWARAPHSKPRASLTSRA